MAFVWTYRSVFMTAGFVAAVLCPSAPVSADESIVLRGISPYQQQNYLAQPLFLFASILEKKTDGKIKLDYVGGEEVVPALEQFDAVRNGAVDVALGIASYYTGTVPEAIGIQYNRSKLPEDLRKNGYHELMKELHATKANVIYVANASGTPGSAFRLYSSRKVEKPSDMAGMKFRVSPVYTAIVQSLGATPVSMPPADTYAALERGIVDGLGWTYGGTLDYGFPEVAKYVINHPFYSLNSAIIMNEAAWDRIPDDLKPKVEEAAIEFEKEVVKYYAEYISAEDEKLKKAGAEFITFSDSDAESYVNAAYESGWSDFIKANSENGQKIKDMMD